MAASELPPPSPAATGIPSRCGRARTARPASVASSSERGDERVLWESLDAARRPCSIGSRRRGRCAGAPWSPRASRRVARADDEGEVDLRVARRADSRARRAQRTRPAPAPRPESRAASDRGEGLLRLRARRDAGQRSEFGSVLRRCANAASTTRLTAEVAPELAAAEGDERGVDVRLRPEHRPRDGWNPVRSAASWTSTETAPYALVLRERRTGRPPRAGPSRTSARPKAAVEALDDDRRGDVVGEVGDELFRGRIERREVDRERVADSDPDVLARAGAAPATGRSRRRGRARRAPPGTA